MLLPWCPALPQVPKPQGQVAMDGYLWNHKLKWIFLLISYYRHFFFFTAREGWLTHWAFWRPKRCLGSHIPSAAARSQVCKVLMSEDWLWAHWPPLDSIFYQIHSPFSGQQPGSVGECQLGDPAEGGSGGSDPRSAFSLPLIWKGWHEHMGSSLTHLGSWDI